MTTHDRLRHDLAKYIARTARNVDVDRDGNLDEELRAMLCDDLYATYRGERASTVLARHVGDDARYVSVRALLREVDALEGDVRRGDAVAVQRAITLALQIAEALSA